MQYTGGNTDVGSISYNSLLEYHALFEKMYLVENTPAFSLALRSASRVGKGVKRHLADPSLCVSLLQTDKERLIGDPYTFGYLFEALCERDLDIYARASGGSLRRYRDYQNNEIDAVIEYPDGRWGAFEIKLSSAQTDSAAKNLLKITAMLEKKGARRPEMLCVICGLCPMAYRRKDGVYVVPIAFFRN